MEEVEVMQGKGGVTCREGGGKWRERESLAVEGREVGKMGEAGEGRRKRRA